MKAVLLDAGSPEALHPVTANRLLAQFPVANVALGERQKAALAGAGFELVESALPGKGALYVRGDAWLSPDAIRWLAAQKAPAVATDQAGKPLAWVGTTPETPRVADALSPFPDSFLFAHPWDLLRVNAAIVESLASDCIEGTLSERATVEGRLVLGAGSRVLPGVYIEGNVVIGRDCKIGPNCYLRGNTSIGDRCHIGQSVEIKNSIVLSHAAIGHLSYCGDSIVGERANFGAGTITANFRHDGKSHRTAVCGKFLDTGMRKVGAIIGDDVHTGIHTSIYPGRKIWPGRFTRPGAIVDKDIH